MLSKYYGDYGIPLGKNLFIPLNFQNFLTIIPLAAIAYLVLKK